jgi:hypothetical protein
VERSPTGYIRPVEGTDRCANQPIVTAGVFALTVRARDAACVTDFAGVFEPRPYPSERLVE